MPNKENPDVDRSLTVGRPWGRARTMGGGSLMVFDYHETREECLKAIDARPNPAVAMFPVFLPHLEREQ